MRGDVVIKALGTASASEEALRELRLGLPRMRSAHRTFNIFLEIDGVMGERIAFVSELTPDRSRLYAWVRIGVVQQVLYQCLTGIDMAMAVVKAKNPQRIVVFEHKPQYSLLLYVACLVKRAPVYFFVHGIQQNRLKSPFHACGFRLLQWMVKLHQFWPIHLEVDDGQLPAAARFSRSLVIPHPVASIPTPRIAEYKAGQVRIGIAGMLRPDKPVKGLLHAVKNLRDLDGRYKITIGTPAWQMSADVRESGFDVVDTTTADQYEEYFRTCDVILTFFERSAFFFRPSGIIHDAITYGCFVIAPRFPVFEAQIGDCGLLGTFYNSLDELPRILSANAEIMAKRRGCEKPWLALREPNKVIRQLAQLILDSSR